jgi:hypothetical protein
MRRYDFDVREGDANADHRTAIEVCDDGDLWIYIVRPENWRPPCNHLRVPKDGHCDAAVLTQTTLTRHSINQRSIADDALAFFDHDPAFRSGEWLDLARAPSTNALTIDVRRQFSLLHFFP